MKIVCSKCGSEKMVRKDVLVARIIKFGSYENLVKNYECLKCRPKNDLTSAIKEAEAILAAKSES